MSNDFVNYGLPLLGVTVGLAVLLYGEYAHMGDTVVFGAGAVVVLAVGLMTAAIAQS